MKIKILSISSLILFLVALAILFRSNYSQSDISSNINPTTNTQVEADLSSPPQDVDFTAQFSIKTNGLDRVFSSSMYHNRSDDVYIQRDNPHVIHIKKSDITWNDFFSTLPFKLTQECLTTGDGDTFCTGQNGSLQFYLNGARDENALERFIQADDRLEVVFGE